MSERCEKCKTGLDFPCAREVLDKKRTCSACGHVQRVEKSILYVVETLEEQVEWLHERVAELEAKYGIVARPKPLALPPKTPIVHPPAPLVDLLSVAEAVRMADEECATPAEEPAKPTFVLGDLI